MKISYKVLQNYIPNLDSPEEVGQNLIMHTAEVEEIMYEGKSFENIVYGKITSLEDHPDADSLRVCMVDIGENEEVQIVCGGSNLEVNQAVAVAKIGAVVSWHGEETITMKKTKIRGVESSGMICASEEIGLLEDFPQKDEKEILDISHIEAKTGTPLADLLDKNDAILEVDNKAINHRPDLFSHIGIAREITAISGEKLDFDYETYDFSSLPDLGIQNKIPELVSRYMGTKMEDVENIKTPEYIKQVLHSAEISSKGLLVDITNYSLYLYGQPTHCFDADKITGNITVRKAKDGETFTALDDKEYTLNETDIVIADEAGVIALGGIIGGKDSSVSDSTKNIIIESAHFDQAVVRKTGKRLGIRTDALNVFEKDIVNDLQDKATALIIKELEKNISEAKVTAGSDIYTEKQKEVFVDFDLNFYNNLIGKKFEESEVISILKNLGIELQENKKLKIPFWRKDIHYKADIAEEIARISGYNNIESTIPDINMGATEQENIYNLKLDARNFLTSIGFYDMYTYSFVNAELMQKCLGGTEDLVEMKNALSEEMTHLRGSLIPNLLQALEKNGREYTNLKLFELEKVFRKKDNDTDENYFLSGVQTSSESIAYYEIQNTLRKLFASLGITSYSFEGDKNTPSFAHSGRTAKIILRGKAVGFVGEIHPKVANNFELETRIGFFEINVDLILQALYSKVKAKEVSNFQENNFDVNFVVEKTTPASKVKAMIQKADQKLIRKVEIIDIYENNEKLGEKRSITYKVFIQSMDGTLDDKVKALLIEKIVKNVEKIGGELR